MTALSLALCGFLPDDLLASEGKGEWTFALARGMGSKQNEPVADVQYKAIGTPASTQQQGVSGLAVGGFFPNGRPPCPASHVYSRVAQIYPVSTEHAPSIMLRAAVATEHSSRQIGYPLLALTIMAAPAYKRRRAKNAPFPASRLQEEALSSRRGRQAQ
ncbi:hypothetical protein M441DRAFT_45898 [Trichoderma asperellum CBS 433.97]|uniref:Uncharacterized protein n=1 Tax=Trichoderma asperellum (strain ATCC 204424 / CBS 433.97 / NBRC 101777) TaxID=1042311 RepID=A0A2T3ZBK8_TRIA4|nr:hypothetical protein M441DRAFT_45898 [Trichoderma asperellum CBS 433.97]PTB42194.1 hypothetical protein M441DRAFT_45898 [Trichoderma asperellum CBS 433.97]